ncbi:acetyltransferase, GNAT family [Candidatus Phaeomarinobacter ectocarpi]|uniref:Acetyltransferase, GNAT family n=1 Tax=Candidatus Phaeomarinibacter ectocarpi TaxID=1458461 RepID=X5MLJ7_9HYPH|nr:GNAT family N-acetyltransferase [Candidatus Phaeomarinobacter ectocarpi]CDO58466.1 acetyltransferase, GNAT family [Candidatus Phaeomarinobacter ectocarpi]
MAVQIELVHDALPDGIDALVTASKAEGIRNISMLVDQWHTGEQRFNQHNAALFAAFQHGQLAGIGGITREDGLDEPAMRVRRFYVLPPYRRSGIATALARACMTHGLRICPTLTCNAQASDAAGVFWQAMGFDAVQMPTITHVFQTAKSR